MEAENKNTKQKIKQELANYLGVEIEDIEDETVLTEDLHMTPLDLTDFIEEIKTKGFDTTKVELTEVETFEDLTENITLT